ncbi:hypothetical protein [Halodurantibacterium flavum]|uniref:Uncharacterized protein n=1 Tax=Halodurantibacterium flavum TaxID=1382802 RepID=A0ABW4SAR3_9RHOB
MTTLCHVTDRLEAPDGSPLPGARLDLIRVPAEIEPSATGTTTVPAPVSVRADPAAQISVHIKPGRYAAKLADAQARPYRSFMITVPDAPHAILGQLIDAPPPPPEPDAMELAVRAAQNARDEANGHMVAAGQSNTSAALYAATAEVAAAAALLSEAMSAEIRAEVQASKDVMDAQLLEAANAAEIASDAAETALQASSAVSVAELRVHASKELCETAAANAEAAAVQSHSARDATLLARDATLPAAAAAQEAAGSASLAASSAEGSASIASEGATQATAGASDAAQSAGNANASALIATSARDIATSASVAAETASVMAQAAAEEARGYADATETIRLAMIIMAVSFTNSQTRFVEACAFE